VSKKSQKRRGPRPASTIAPRPAAAADPAGRPRLTRTTAGVLGVSVAAIGLVAIWAIWLAPRETRTGGLTATQAAGPSASSMAGSSTSGSTSPSGASAVPGGSAAPGASAEPGGQVAEAVIAALHADPFKAHVEESILASTITKGARITITAKAVGDVSGKDAAIRTSGTGNGPPTDEQIVTVGDVAWIKATAARTWEVHPRSVVAPSLDGLLSTVQPLDDPLQLQDVGVETLDGVAVHHLTAVGAVAYHSLNGIDGVYDNFDIWATAEGIPVDMKATFSEIQGIDSITGSTEIRYTKVGGPITITPPAAAPTLAPSTTP
jgi:hypothetical protein